MEQPGYPLYYNENIPPYYFYLVPVQGRAIPPPQVQPAVFGGQPIPPKVPTFTPRNVRGQEPPVGDGIPAAKPRLPERPHFKPYQKSKGSSSPWKSEEDLLLKHLRDEKGLAWREISLSFPHRTINGCQLRYRRLSSLKQAAMENAE